jgi:Bacterial transcriptional activator domain
VDALREDAAWMEERRLSVLEQRVDANLKLGRHTDARSTRRRQFGTG